MEDAVTFGLSLFEQKLKGPSLFFFFFYQQDEIMLSKLVASKSLSPVFARAIHTTSILQNTAGTINHYHDCAMIDNL